MQRILVGVYIDRIGFRPFPCRVSCLVDGRESDNMADASAQNASLVDSPIASNIAHLSRDQRSSRRYIAGTCYRYLAGD